MKSLKIISVVFLSAIALAIGGGLTEKLTFSGDGSSQTSAATNGGATVVTNTLPTGTILDFAGTNAPSGFVLCNGAAVSRTTYTNLLIVIGETWGAGDGLTTFNVPDLRARTTVGAGQGTGLSNRVLGETNGWENITLDISCIPAHTHELNRYNGSGSIAGTYQTASSAGVAQDTTSAGGGGSHSNMPPYAVVNKIIKD